MLQAWEPGAHGPQRVRHGKIRAPKSTLHARREEYRGLAGKGYRIRVLV